MTTETKESLPFEPAPGSQADIDYIMWVKYLDDCEKNKLKPSIRDFVVWLGEQDEHTLTKPRE